jgi:uncharacterized protein YgiB involved in biofilm formation
MTDDATPPTPHAKAHAAGMARPGARGLRAVLLGASAFGLAACEDDPEVAAQAYPTLEACLAADDAVTDPATCEAAHAAALQAHEASAPRYDEEALCEEQHGSACVEEVRGDGSHVFLPLMTGYLVGRALTGGQSRVLSSPLYGVQGGGYATPSGATRVTAAAGPVTVRASGFQPAAATAAQAPLTRATIAGRGGFGAARASGGGFGG